MKKENKFVLALCLLFLIVCSCNIYAQDSNKEKQIKIKTVIVSGEDGEENTWDTTCSVENHDNKDIRKFIIKGCSDTDTAKCKKIIVKLNGDHFGMKGLHKGGHKKAFKWHTFDSACEGGMINIVIGDTDSLGHIHKKIDKELIILADDLDCMHGEMGEIECEIEAIINNANELEKEVHLEKVKVIAEKIKDYKNPHFRAYHGAVDKAGAEWKEFSLPEHGHHFLIWASNELEENDLKKIKKYGLKTGNEKLDIDHVLLYGYNDSFNLKFKLESTGQATIKIVSEDGKEVFADNVQYFPGTYDKTTTLNKDGSGLYYIYIEQNRKTYTCKVKLD